MSRNIRVLIAKPGLDGHDRGAKVVVRGLRDAGMEVIYLGLRVSAEQIVEAAVQEDVDVVGLSCLSGAHMALFPRTVELLREKGLKDVLVIAGGIIPQEDVVHLKEVGFAEVFGPGTPIDRIASFIRVRVGGQTPMIKKVNHIGIAVNSIEEASRLYTEVLGLKIKNIETVADQKVKIAVIPVGDTRIELLESTDPEGPVAKHIKARGEGLHHIAFEVDDIRAALDTLQKKEIPLVDKTPRIGGGHAQIAFLHPKATKALIELMQPSE